MKSEFDVSKLAEIILFEQQITRMIELFETENRQSHQKPTNFEIGEVNTFKLRMSQLSKSSFKEKDNQCHTRSQSARVIRKTSARLILLMPEESAFDKPSKIRIIAESLKSQREKSLAVKTSVISSYSNSFQVLNEKKKGIENDIQLLKNLINSEKKMKAKTSLTIHKIMNECEKEGRKLQIKKEENYHLSVSIAALEKQNEATESEKEKSAERLSEILRKKSEIENECLELSKFMEEASRAITQTEKEINQIYVRVSQASNYLLNTTLNKRIAEEERIKLHMGVQ